MLDNGVVDASRSRNITARALGAGVYCVAPTSASGINPATVLPVVTADYSATVIGNTVAMVRRYSPGAGCNSSEFAILTFDAYNGVTQDTAFSLIAP